MGSGDYPYLKDYMTPKVFVVYINHLGILIGDGLWPQFCPNFMVRLVLKVRLQGLTILGLGPTNHAMYGFWAIWSLRVSVCGDGYPRGSGYLVFQELGPRIHHSRYGSLLKSWALSIEYGHKTTGPALRGPQHRSPNF